MEGRGGFARQIVKLVCQNRIRNGEELESEEIVGAGRFILESPGDRNHQVFITGRVNVQL